MSVLHGNGLAHGECWNLMWNYGEVLASEFMEHASTRALVDSDTYLVGSVAVNGFGNDIDVVLKADSLDDVAAALDEAGWALVAAEMYRGIYSDGWFSAKKGDFNLLVSEEAVVTKWVLATRACRELRKVMQRDLTRDERVAIHRGVFDD